MYKKILLTSLLLIAFGAGPAVAAELKVGVVNINKIMSESAPAVAAQNKLKTYFKNREDDLNAKVRDFKAKAAKFEKESAVMTETNRLDMRRQLAEEEREINRLQQTLVEESRQRRQEESQIILARTQRIIQDIAKTQKFDLILQEVVWASPRLDITPDVIKKLNAPTN